MIPCPKCKVENPDGSMICSACLEPLPQAVGGTAAPSAAIAPPQPQNNMVFRVLESGIPSPSKFFNIPIDGSDFTLVLGRPDLGATPPQVPDVDLSKMTDQAPGKTDEGKDGVGWHVSRRQAMVLRRSGKIYLKHLGTAKTLFKPTGAADWKALAQDEEVELGIGSDMGFGSTSAMLFFRLCDK
ncbi:MAG: hypothetical protein V1645_04450 [archaeon]